MQYPMHGANPAALYKGLGLSMPEEIIDVSENVNSLGLPQRVKEQWPNLLQATSFYPNEQAEPFTSVAAAHHSIQAEYVVAANGAAEALMVLAQQFQGEPVVLLEPSFSEYRRTLALYQCEIRSVVASDIMHGTFDGDLLRKALLRASALYICNPNNPTGVLQAKAWIESLLLAFPDVTIVVDEAFMDWTNEAESVVSLVPKYEQLIVLRSMTKMYSLAGVRLGYIVSQQASALKPFFPHWHVSQLAIEMGTMCLAEHAFVEQSRLHADRLRAQMQAFFLKQGCYVSNSVANFFVFQLPAQFNADDFFIAMLKEGIVLRHTKNYAGLGSAFRIAVKNEAIWQRCKEVILRYVQDH